MGGNTISDNSMNPILAQMDQFLKTVGQQVGGAQGKEIGNAIDQGFQGADKVLQGFMGAFGMGSSPGAGTAPGQCPKCPQPFSPSQFPGGIFDNPSQHFPKIDAGSGGNPFGNDPGFNLPKGQHGDTPVIPNDPGFTPQAKNPTGIQGSIPDDPGFNIPKTQHGNMPDIPNDPGFTPQAKNPTGIQGSIPNDSGFTPKLPHHADIKDSIPNDPGFSVGGRNWPSEAAKSRGGTNWDNIRKAVDDARKSGNPAHLQAAQQNQQTFLNGCKMLAGTIFNSAADMAMTVGRDLGLR
ncbi:MAG TPA: hypothetical protein VHW45_04620 [Candidatus Sulfotelmatobacter sp.]|jgi:hypothetical protein|nr:hypothetical protein [Candidatus Sulfotelmatobacter sp.]